MQANPLDTDPGAAQMSETYRAPVEISGENSVTRVTRWLTVLAEYRPATRETRHDPGEPEHYEIDDCWLRFDEELKALVDDCAGFHLDGGRSAWVSVGLDWKPGSIWQLDDPDLMDEISAYLQRNQ